MEKSALQFYKDIQKEKDKYKLVNGLFIVKYLDKEICQFIGDFLQSGRVLNEGKTNKVKICPTNQKFNKRRGLGTNARGDIWRELNIGFREEPIEEILR